MKPYVPDTMEDALLYIKELEMLVEIGRRASKRHSAYKVHADAHRIELLKKVAKLEKENTEFKNNYWDVVCRLEIIEAEYGIHED